MGHTAVQHMTYSQGYLTVGSFDGAPIRIHWTTPLAAFVLGACHWAPLFWLAYALVVLTHEIGHALMVRRVGGTIESIEATGWGGHCEASGSLTEFEEALVAGGGVLAQAVLFAVVGLLYMAFGYPQNELILELVAALLGLNLFLLLINLLPIPPLDGAGAWPLALYGIALLREMRSRSDRFRLRQEGENPRRRDHLRHVRLDERLERQLDDILKDARRKMSENERSNQDK